MFDLHEILDQPPPPLTVVDVGAASMGEGTDPYENLVRQPGVNVIGFEPNQEACAKRNAGARPNQRYLPYFIGDGAPHRFYQCANPLTSSLYEPNHPLLDKFQNLSLPVTGVSSVQTVRLDDIGEIDDCDFLKLDIQGAELDAINGGQALLQNVMVVHTEVEFIPMYQGQPLFGDVDVKLRELGFLLHKFDKIFSRQMKPLIVNNDPYSPFSQIIFAEAAIYVRNFMAFDALPVHKRINLARILHSVYGSYDLCAVALESIDRTAGMKMRDRYLERLTRGGA
ncbi:MAG: FkbM family methyltransferase [Gammaproteobacteria bacterium]|nr:FkbM family methyltransferase [Gammaproteobacteria bacterium]